MDCRVKPGMTKADYMISPFSRGNLVGMNKRLETLLDRIATWPEEAQADAAMALADIEEKVRVLRSLTHEQQAKLEALRQTVNRSIEEGGSYADEEVEAGIAANLDAWESKRKGG
jgi:uncharacterized protein YerC